MQGLTGLVQEIRRCTVCAKDLPLGPNPILTVNPAAKILLIGQAPGTKVHASGISWNDASGDRLRSWLDVDRETFYNTEKFSIMPMGYCYPGKGKSGDNPPRSECAPLWHLKVLSHLPNLELIILIGSYAHNYYLGSQKKKTLAGTVREFREYEPAYLPLVHPSPRNQLWLKNNPWFEKQVVIYLRERVAELIK